MGIFSEDYPGQWEQERQTSALEKQKRELEFQSWELAEQTRIIREQKEKQEREEESAAKANMQEGQACIAKALQLDEKLLPFVYKEALAADIENLSRMFDDEFLSKNEKVLNCSEISLKGMKTIVDAIPESDREKFNAKITALENQLQDRKKENAFEKACQEAREARISNWKFWSRVGIVSSITGIIMVLNDKSIGWLLVLAGVLIAIFRPSGRGVLSDYEREEIRNRIESQNEITTGTEYKCSDCGTVNDADAIYCEQCGKPRLFQTFRK